MLNRRWVSTLGFVALVVIFSSAARQLHAKPVAPAALCQSYGKTKTCEGGPPACTLCHSVAPARNAFGQQVSEHLAVSVPRPLTDQQFLQAIQTALKAIERMDADKDGVDNLSEIEQGSHPADAASQPLAPGCSAQQISASSRSRWNVCRYDPVFAFRRIHLDFCGTSPSWAEVAEFSKLVRDRRQWEPALARQLDRCLSSRYWLGKDGVVWNLANPKIRPIDSVKSGPDSGPVPLADYYFDYDLFTWANSGDRDVRDLLLAQYFVKRVSDNPPSFRVLSEEELKKLPLGSGQNVPPAKRAGMLTTRWFTTVNTMFTAIPRTTAAQAYRAYLGFDISHMEGLHPVPNEPAEYDRKGVTAPTCAFCHSTLDPLAYPFSRYNGIFRNDFAPDRLKSFVRIEGPDVVRTPEKGVLFGKEVKDLLEFAQVAANSPEFARNVVRDYWKLLIGREPQAQDQPEFGALWRGLMDPQKFNYRVEKMLHALVLTEAYGRP
ncbi:MAG: hypothetical protein NZV14_15215 [Bryobacteraceae bacterium]|nr:hypothetical protein [Bryobacteraceae bacterium]MDW8379513.1 hypothetical protein [Bryobacterales bacterium]